MKVIVAPDSFKGSLTAAEVAEVVSAALEQAVPGCEVCRLPVSDGGEGLVQALAPVLGAVLASAQVHGPLGRMTSAAYAVKGDLAVIEMAAASGLELLEPDELDVMNADSRGLGELILDALDRGCREFLIGIGGSATNDAGMGMLHALGWRFLDASGNVLSPKGASLESVVEIDDSKADVRLRDASFRVACDVDNPLYGPEGAAAVFAPQKGADPRQAEALDRGLRNFARVVRAKTGADLQAVPGSGAAGGVGGALSAFLAAPLLPGAHLVLSALGFDALAAGADLVITGEGCLDAQSLHGKACFAVLEHCRSLAVPAVALCGIVRDAASLSALGFEKILPVKPGGQSLEEAMRKDVAQANIRKAVLGLFGPGGSFRSPSPGEV